MRQDLVSAGEEGCMCCQNKGFCYQSKGNGDLKVVECPVCGSQDER